MTALKQNLKHFFKIIDMFHTYVYSINNFSLIILFANVYTTKFNKLKLSFFQFVPNSNFRDINFILFETVLNTT